MGAAQRWGGEFHGHVVNFKEILVETFLVSQELDVGEVCQREENGFCSFIIPPVSSCAVVCGELQRAA